MVDAAAMIATRSLTWRVVRQLSEQQVDLLIAIGLTQRKQRLLLARCGAQVSAPHPAYKRGTIKRCVNEKGGVTFRLYY